MTLPPFSSFPDVAGIPAERLSAIQSRFLQDWMQLAEQARQGSLATPPDRRFRGEAWSAQPTSLFSAHAYLLSVRTAQELVEAAQLDNAARERLRFAVMQWLEAMSPANFLATNPDAQRKLVETGGESLRQGTLNFLTDLRRGRLSQTDESRYEVGSNLATTPGAVVYENSLMQLIQYAPLTAQTYRRPVLIVPPCINKFYILDLQPENSFVRYAVEQGHTVFLVSWRNPMPNDTDGIQQATWDEYLTEGVQRAIDVAADITGESQINALGFCVGGTLLASALAHLAAQDQHPVASLTLLTTLLDFSDTGVLGVFVDEFHAQWRDQQFRNGGLMTAQELGTTFSFLRPSELVWNYVEGNYLKGESPPAFDLLYWNADGTHLPGPFFAWYFRNTYLENRLAVPGGVSLDGVPLDLGALEMPVYLYGSREDHIVPWRSAYASTGLLNGATRFVLGASGHIAGVINPPAKQRRSYWAVEGGASPSEPADAWLARATEHAGSWWSDWAGWLSEHGGRRIRARRKLGNARYTPIEEAPGRYVRQRAA